MKVVFQKFLLKKLIQGVLHTIFWCTVLLFYTYFFGVESNNFDYVLSFSLFLMPITIATTYVSIYKLIPDYLIKKRYFYFTLYCVYTFIISTYLIVVSVFFGLVYLSNFKYLKMAPISRNMVFVAVSVYLIVIMVSAFKLLKLNLKHSEETKQLENKILETQLQLKEQELNYLKMQIHPHFLFNTLNTLYGFALKKADETPEMILRLSNLLDYLLYQVDKPFVSIQEEINHIEDYLKLEKLRFNDSLSISFNTYHPSEDLKIAPMLLLPFVENSFKHGTLHQGQLKIKIDLKCENQNIWFYVENTTSRSEPSPKGIGLDNIKKRLDLLYPNNYTLDIKNEGNFFKVALQLRLS
ncbi:histidine kinase [Aquimarina sp. ERC-38]|uniref:sensor histidine kinase n=1 Tax=Aquimarina sp. ERC-38 TaxID=2949996 RepID=UPI0022465982|nr:histidine kinase [Aquimarina sp. ERC-38]UZO82707.1 histidine kinase [Aquimarina sp. ERC-38]